MKRFVKTIKKMPWTAKFGFIVIFIWIFFAIFTDFLEPHDPTKVDVTLRMIPPSWCEGGTSEYLLGTDEMGRDVLSRLMHGSRLALIVGILAVVVSLIIGVTLGLLAGFFGGWVDSVIMRIVDMMLSFPFIFMALCFMAVLGSSLFNVILVLGITGWVPYTRQIRASVLALQKERICGGSWDFGRQFRMDSGKAYCPQCNRHGNCPWQYGAGILYHLGSVSYISRHGHSCINSHLGPNDCHWA